MDRISKNGRIKKIQKIIVLLPANLYCTAVSIILVNALKGPQNISRESHYSKIFGAPQKKVQEGRGEG